MIVKRQTTYMARVEEFREDGVRVIKKSVKPPAIGNIKLEFLGFLPKCMCTLEVKALEALKGVPGTPQLVRRDSPCSFIASFLESTPVQRVPHLPIDYFDKLFRLLAAVHARGVVDLDLVHERDTGIGPDGNPVLMDFGLCLTFRQPARSLRKKVFEYLCRQHRIRYIEMEEKYFPGRIRPAEKGMRRRWCTLSRIERGVHGCRRLLTQWAQSAFKFSIDKR